MCGIFGFSVPNLPKNQRSILAAMLVNGNVERGNHSWGLVGFKHDNEIEINRYLGPMSMGGAVLASKYVNCFAHTRFATHGAKTIENTHPFEIGNTVGCHNGIIYNNQSLNAKYDRKHEVDSMHLIQHIDENLPIDDFDGYGTLAWTNKKDPGKIYLSRMSGGELAIYGIGTPDNCQGVVFSSDEDHLIEAMLMAGIDDGFRFATPEAHVLFVENGKLYQDTKGRKLKLSEDYGPTRLKWQDYMDRGLSSDPGKDHDERDDESPLQFETLIDRPIKDKDDSHKLWPERDPWYDFVDDENREWQEYLDSKASAKTKD